MTKDEALAQPEQEPRNIRERWNIELDGDDLLVCFNDHEKSEGCRYERYMPATTASPQPEPVIDKSAAIRIATALGWEPKRTWVGLTEDEFKQIMLDTYNIDLNVPGHSSDDHLLWRAIEAKLRSKNT